MKTTSEILEELLNKSHEIEKFINTHSLSHSPPDANLRQKYAAHHFYISLDWHRAVVLLTAKQYRGPALTLIRPMLESWIKGTWIRLVASDAQIEDVATSSKFWIDEKDVRLWDLIKEVNKKDQFVGEWMKGLWAAVDQYLNDCVHGNNNYLNLYLDNQTLTFARNAPEDLMVAMLDVTNSVALWSANQMNELHTQDPHHLILFITKLKEYLGYSTELLQPIRLQLARKMSGTQATSL